MKNTLEVAEKLILDNMEYIENLRHDEEALRKVISDLEERVKQQEDAIFVMKRNLAKHMESLTDIREEKLEYLVSTLALKAFIEDGGGLDMMDEEE